MYTSCIDSDNTIQVRSGARRIDIILSGTLSSSRTTIGKRICNCGSWDDENLNQLGGRLVKVVGDRNCEVIITKEVGLRNVSPISIYLIN